MQTEKLLKKIEKSFEEFLKTKLKKQSFSLVFGLPQITIKWNMKLIDEEQFKLKKLSEKNSWFLLHITKTQKWTLVEKISFETEQDYLSFLQKTAYFKNFSKNIEIIESCKIAKLLFLSWNFRDFLEQNIFKIVEFDGKWWDILKVVEYFLQNKKSNLFLRELSIRVHSKFIENNKKVINDILDFLYKNLELELAWNTFEEKFSINKKPDFVRLRFLDKNLQQKYFWVLIDDFSLKIADFEKLDISGLENIYIIENEINYLTFPKKEKSIVIFWAWFNAWNLKNTIWLQEKNIFYFWDIDSHWFKILAHFRKYFLQTKSIFMDKNTFKTFERRYAVNWKTIPKDEGQNLEKYLTKEEFELFSFVNENNSRLEQENITQDYIKIKL